MGKWHRSAARSHSQATMAAACKHMVASTETLGKLAQMHPDSAKRKARMAMPSHSGRRSLTQLSMLSLTTLETLHLQRCAGN